MSKTRFRFFLLWLLCLLPGPVQADPRDGVYGALVDAREYRLVLEADNFGRYDGILFVDGEKPGIEATRLGDRLAGQLGGPDGFARISLELRSPNLLLLSWQDGRTLRLLRIHR